MTKRTESIKKTVSPILKKYGVKRAAIFGSTARGNAKNDSDIDILIEFNGSLFGFISLKFALEKKLHKKVDLVEYKAINPNLKESILENQVRIL